MIDLIVEMKQRNPHFGCRRIAMQISNRFDVDIDKNELLDQTLFWNSVDLQCKLVRFQGYFNESRSHMGIDGETPNQKATDKKLNLINFNRYKWKSHCRGLFQLPIAAEITLRHVQAMRGHFLP